ncbi:MAG: hypothetical protein KKG59_05045 [Nanoarchaeota archaeon]|nr:hypothetical protein [Nanoarchaeota archaeon]
MTRSHHYALFVFVVIFALVLSISLAGLNLLLMQNIQTSNQGWNGFSKASSSIKSANNDVRTLLFSINSLGNENIVIFAPKKVYTKDDSQMLLQKVQEGSTLLISDNSLKTFFLLRAFNITQGTDIVVDFEKYNRRQDLPIVSFNHYSNQGTLALRQPGYILSAPRQASILAMTSKQSYTDTNDDQMISDADTKGPFPIALRAKVGKGKVIYVADKHIFSNDMIDREQNHEFFESLLAEFSPTRPIILDETHSKEQNIPVDIINLSMNAVKKSNIVVWSFIIIFLVMILPELITLLKRKEVKRKSARGKFAGLCQQIKSDAKKKRNLDSWMIENMGRALIEQIQRRAHTKTEDPEELTREIHYYHPEIDATVLNNLIIIIISIEKKHKKVSSAEAKTALQSIEDILAQLNRQNIN